MQFNGWRGRCVSTIRKMRIVLFENIQAVTSFSLQNVADEFLGEDIDVLILGEPEKRTPTIIKALLKEESLDSISGLAFKAKGETFFTRSSKLENELDDLPLPAWDLFPLEGYWLAGFAHAPCGKDKFLPLLTSRGCPFRCKFCLSPFLNPKWRFRSAVNVVDEMEHFYRTMGITEFHVSDLNPTVSDKTYKGNMRGNNCQRVKIDMEAGAGN